MTERRPHERPRAEILSRQDAERAAEQAWEAYQALIRCETPELRNNPFWQPLKDTAHARFRAMFEVIQ